LLQNATLSSVTISVPTFTSALAKEERNANDTLHSESANSAPVNRDSLTSRRLMCGMLVYS